MNMHFRPQIQNGQIVKRSRPALKASGPKTNPFKFAGHATLTPLWAGVSVSEIAHTGLSALALDEKLRSATVASKTTSASRVKTLLSLIGCGVLLAGGFMFSLRDHFIAHAYGQTEVKLQSQVDRTTSVQRTLAVQFHHAASPQEIDRAAQQQTSLAPIVLEQKKSAGTTKTITTTEKAMAGAAHRKNSPRVGEPTN